MLKKRYGRLEKNGINNCQEITIMGKVRAHSTCRTITSWDLKVMRNEIYARLGYIFKTDDMKNYFNEQNW